MVDAIVQILTKSGVNVADCRGQSHDTAPNMSGVKKGLQTIIKELSPLAIYIPCGGHVLNLSICHTVESSDAAARFCMFVQNIYVFFSA